MATLVEIREQFIKLCGRFDLVVDTTDYADNGADWFIKAGQRMLDRMMGFPLDQGRYFQTLSAGEYYIEFDNCRAIYDVYAANSEQRWRLDHLYWNDFIEDYDEPWANITNGTAAFYTQALMRGLPDFGAVDALSGYATEVATDNTDLTKRGIIIAPPTDESIHIEVLGLFDTPTLTNDSDKNFWSEKWEDLLVFAALYKLEVSYRNSEGAKDWLAEIHRMVGDIDKDEIEFDANQAQEMNG